MEEDTFSANRRPLSANLTNLMNLPTENVNLARLFKENEAILNEMNTDVPLDLSQLNVNEDLKLYLQKLDKLLDIFQTFFNISETLKSQMKDFKQRILLFEKMDYEVDKGLLNFVTDCKKGKYLEKLKVVKDTIVQIENYEKLLEGD